MRPIDSIEIEDVKFDLQVGSGVVTVSHPEYGTQTTQVGGSTVEHVARMLARELMPEERPE